MSLPDPSADQFIAQYLRHYDRHWYGIRKKLVDARDVISAALAAEGVKVPLSRTELSIYRVHECKFWGKTPRKRPAERDEFDAKEWDRMDQWIEKHSIVPLDTVASVMRRMLKDGVTTSLTGAREALLWRKRQVPFNPPPFKFDPTLTPAKD